MHLHKDAPPRSMRRGGGAFQLIRRSEDLQGALSKSVEGSLWNVEQYTAIAAGQGYTCRRSAGAAPGGSIPLCCLPVAVNAWTPPILPVAVAGQPVVRYWHDIVALLRLGLGPWWCAGQPLLSQRNWFRGTVEGLFSMLCWAASSSLGL